MATSRSTGYGTGDPKINLAPVPIVANRAPSNVNDLNYDIAQIWLYNNLANSIQNTYIFFGGNTVSPWVLLAEGAGALSTLSDTSGTIVTPVADNIQLAGTTNEIAVTAGVGVLTFSVPSTFVAPGTLSSVGNTTLATSAADTSVTIANAANTGSLQVQIANGASAANSEVDILSGTGTVGAGTLKMANNPRVTDIELGNVAPTAARSTTILGGNSAVNDTLSILGGNPSANTQSATILGGAATGGTQTFGVFTGNSSGATQTVNVFTGTGAGTVNLATGGTTAKTVTIGSVASTSTTSLQAGSGGVQSTPATFTSSAATVNSITCVTGSIKVPATSVSGSTPVVNNVRTGQVGFSDTVSEGMTAVLTMTNSIVTSSSIIIANAICETSGSQVSIINQTPGSGTVAFKVLNSGGTDTTGADVFINFWVLN